MTRRTWPVLLASGLCLALLLWLGQWQVQRLAWKNALIANYETTKVTVSGHFAGQTPLRFMSTAEGAAAWQILQPFETAQGQKILVSRGKIAEAAALPTTPTTTVSLVGHMQTHNKGKGFFDVDNNPAANMWYWWDVDAMVGQASTNGQVLQLVPGSPGTEGLFVDLPKSELSNNHLGYAITWFGLAAVLVVMTAIFLYQSRQSKHASNAVK